MVIAAKAEQSNGVSHKCLMLKSLRNFCAENVIRKRRFTPPKSRPDHRAAFAFTTDDRNSGATVVAAWFLSCVLVIGEGALFDW
jgi:hypothetical protein